MIFPHAAPIEVVCLRLFCERHLPLILPSTLHAHIRKESHGDTHRDASIKGALNENNSNKSKRASLIKSASRFSFSQGHKQARHIHHRHIHHRHIHHRHIHHRHIHHRHQDKLLLLEFNSFPNGFLDSVDVALKFENIRMNRSARVLGG